MAKIEWDDGQMLRDIKAEEVVGFQVDHHNQVWVCVDGRCVLRVAGAKAVEITDLRTPTTEAAAPH